MTLDEWSTSPCEVRGAWPVDVSGTFLRIGPHPRTDDPVARWGTYPGLLHALTIDGHGARVTSTRMGVHHGPSAAVFVHGEQIFAAGEFGPVWSIDPKTLEAQELSPIGDLPWTVPHFHQDDNGSMMVVAHDPRESAMHAYALQDGAWVPRRTLDLPDHHFVHDVQVVGGKLVVGCHPLMRTDRGLAWNENATDSLWFIADLCDESDPVIAPVAPCFAWHGGWASSTATELMLRAPVRPTPGLFPREKVLDHTVRPGVREWRIDHQLQQVFENQITEDPCDFPIPFGEGLIVALAGEFHGGPDYTRCAGVAIIDGQGEVSRRMHPEGAFGAEFLPVETSGGAVLMGLVSDPRNNRSQLMLLDPDDLPGKPVASVEVPYAIPAGLHAAWRPEPAEIV